jgi:hypothetical protein
MKVVKVILYIIVGIVTFILVTLPSIVYGIIPYFLIPIAWLIRLLLHRTVFSYKTGIVALRLSTIVLLVIIPSAFYLYVSKPLGWIFFAWMASYLVIRIYSGVHRKEGEAINAWKKLDALAQDTYTKDNLVTAIITIILNLAALACGYYLGKAQGLWIGAAIAIILWCISPYANKKVKN